MSRHIAKRLLQLPILLVAVSAVVFLVMRLGPGPVDVIAQSSRDPGEIARVRHAFGLDRPLYAQYADYMRGALHGDFGRSYFSQAPVSRVIAERFPATLELAALGMVIGATLGLGLGVLSAVRANGPADTAARTLALVGISLPTFWIGLMFISMFAVRLGWLPVGGRFDPRATMTVRTGFYVLDALLAGDLDAARIALAHLLMPAAVLGVSIGGFIARITRATVLESLRQAYIGTARAKGLYERVVVVRHGLRNALLPIVTILGLQFGTLLGGAAVTETVFSWPGLGRLLVDAIYVRDFPQVQASVLLMAATYVLMNLVVDVLYVFIDPRIRYG